MQVADQCLADPDASAASILRATLLTKVLRIEPSLLRGNCAALGTVRLFLFEHEEDCRQNTEARRLYALYRAFGQMT